MFIYVTKCLWTIGAWNCPPIDFEILDCIIHHGFENQQKDSKLYRYTTNCIQIDTSIVYGKLSSYIFQCQTYSETWIKMDKPKCFGSILKQNKTAFLFFSTLRYQGFSWIFGACPHLNPCRACPDFTSTPTVFLGTCKHIWFQGQVIYICTETKSQWWFKINIKHVGVVEPWFQW